LARPTLNSEAGKWVGGQRRVGVVIALDASYSMAHGEFSSRFKHAVARARLSGQVIVLRRDVRS
jgi:uncharacterized protein (DUF58 family)